MMDDINALDLQLKALAYAMDMINIALAYERTEYSDQRMAKELNDMNEHQPVLLEMQKEIVRMKQEFRSQN